jgi:hypothetical protein
MRFLAHFKLSKGDFMKTISQALSLVILGTGIIAQASSERSESFKQESLFSSESDTVTGAGGFFVGASPLATETAIVAGGQGNAIFNHFFEIGGAGKGVSRRLDILNGKERRLNFGYGGLFVGVTPSSQNLIHPRAHVLIGAGGAHISVEDEHQQNLGHEKAFGVIEPSVGLEVNIFPYGRVYAETAWRQVMGGATVSEYNASDFSSWSAVIGLRFGSF